MKWMLRSVALLVVLAAAPAYAQPVSGECENPVVGPAGELICDLREAIDAAPAPTAREFAENVMKTILEDTEPGKKDRWGYTSDTGDGCFARSYATNYDMLRGKFGEFPEGFTVKTVYIHWKNHSWSYHTAAVVSGPDGDFVVDGLNGEALTVEEWIEAWKMGDKFDRSTLQDGAYMYPGETHNGKPNLGRRKRAQDVINQRKKLKNVPTHPYEEEEGDNS